MASSNVWLAVQILGCKTRDHRSGLIVVVDADQQAQAIATLLGQLDPECASFCFPAWDCLPYDKAPPSPDIMGHRMQVLHDIKVAHGPVIVVTTPEACLQRVPPRHGYPDPLHLKSGEPLDVTAFGLACANLGYTHADRVEDPGHVAIRGEVVDIFPPSTHPARLTVLDGVVASIHRYDPISQRSTGDIQALRLDAVSEVSANGDAPPERFAGMEHWLPLYHPDAETVFDVLPQADLLIEAGAGERVPQLVEQITEAYRDRLAADKHDPDARKPIEPHRMFLSLQAWQDACSARNAPFPAQPPSGEVPLFCLQDKPGKGLASFILDRQAAGRRIVLTSPKTHDLATMAKQGERATGHPPLRLDSWTAVADLPPGALATMKLSANHGFDDEASGITLITSADLLGHYARASSYHAVAAPWHMGDGEFALGDLVIHTEHGVGVLHNLERINSGAANGHEALRLDYAKDVELLAPIDEMGKVWRYGGVDGAVALDKLDGGSWNARKAKITAEIANTAKELVRLAKNRDRIEAPRIDAPRCEYERFVAGFTFAPTPDQIHAVDDCLRDLGTGRPMDRLVVGDVGFGKTEVALRAAAWAVLGGWQVAVVAPTTVLVRQHVEIFKRRFAKIGIEVEHLSRLVSPAEAREVKDRLADGRARLVVGTHALLGKGMSFAKLGLLIVDEEQRFGAAAKSSIREMGSGTHMLTLTATPIPRTLQSALVGLQDLSIIATPPARRRPIRTLVTPFDTAAIRTALLREAGRGGQSFVVAPRIEDLGPLTKTLQALLPDLKLIVAHGRMDTHDVEEAMVAFAGGEGDVLLATSIIESGLDVPRANTMIVCHADRFGIAQLHQLRGRVGRGQRQGTCYLMTEADHAMAEKTQRRLSTLATLDRLGSGLAISAQDLDARGAGDLVGEEQAGHMRLIGLGLYQHLLQRAILAARGEAVAEWLPEIHVGEDSGRFPPDYIPEPEVRLNLYARLARVEDVHDVDALTEEVEDRFGPPPPPVGALFAVARLKALCRSSGVLRIDAGPKAVALTPRDGLTPEALRDTAPERSQAAMTVKDGRVLCRIETADPGDRMRLITNLLHGMH